MSYSEVFISIGSNMGEKHHNCLRGIEFLDASDGVKVVTVSPFYQTEPVDYTDQDWFVNGALKIETTLKPELLMTALKAVEARMGQFEKSVRFGPRILDLDIIFYGDRIMETERVILPHPRMHKRCFVLQPLCDIAPETVHPLLKKSIRSLLMEVENDEGQAVFPLKQN